MKKRLEGLLHAAVTQLQKSLVIPKDIELNILVERARDPEHGDFATNLAMSLAKSARTNPQQLAKSIVGAIPADDCIVKIEIAGPGFINFFIAPSAQFGVIKRIHEEGTSFGKSLIGRGRKVQVEFVSANPTGPLHVGHGRGAAYGAVVANLLESSGFEVDREYYVNDAGRQMDILAASVWLRYLELQGGCFPFPSNGYRGDYVRGIAHHLASAFGAQFERKTDLVFTGITPDEPDGGDKEAHIDEIVTRCKSLLGHNDYRLVFNAGLDSILLDIKEDLEEFGVEFDSWFSELQLSDSGAVEKALNRLKGAGYLYKKDGATWFASSRLGDEKDRVVIRENGQMTYFASDIAYHMNKLDRQYDQIINIWGADHHGYIPRVKAALEALGGDKSKLDVLLVQFAVLYRGEEKVQMSTRSGDFVTLRQLREEVGKDAARFFYVMRKSDQHMDFDLKLATSKTNENPVYYVQYAHARVCSVFRQLSEKNYPRDVLGGMDNLDRLVENHELALISSLSRYPELLEQSALQHAPHHLIHYLRDLSTELHAYYNAHQFLVADTSLRDARLNLIAAVRQVIANGLQLLDVSTPESM